MRSRLRSTHFEEKRILPGHLIKEFLGAQLSLKEMDKLKQVKANDRNTASFSNLICKASSKVFEDQG